MIDALRSYLQLASGIVEATANKAKESATSLISQGLESGAPEIGAQVTEIAEDLLEQSRTNRELLIGLIRTEIDRNIGRMGFVREEELAAVRRHVQRLEQELVTRSGQATDLATAAVNTAASAGSAIIDAASMAASSAAGAAMSAPSARKTATNTKEATAPAAVAPSAKQAPAKQATAKKAPAKRSTAKDVEAKGPAVNTPSSQSGSAATAAAKEGE